MTNQRTAWRVGNPAMYTPPGKSAPAQVSITRLNGTMFCDLMGADGVVYRDVYLSDLQPIRRTPQVARPAPVGIGGGQSESDAGGSDVISGGETPASLKKATQKAHEKGHFPCTEPGCSEVRDTRVKLGQHRYRDHGIPGKLAKRKKAQAMEAATQEQPPDLGEAVAATQESNDYYRGQLDGIYRVLALLFPNGMVPPLGKP